MEVDDSYISVDLGLDGDRPEFGKIDYDFALRPVTIRQLRQAQRAYDEAPFTINGKKLNQIVVVASLLREIPYPGKAKYEIDDGTERIDVWRTLALPRRKSDRRHDNPEVEEGEEWEANVRLNVDYVRVVGTLQQRTRNGSPSGPTIQAVSVQSIGNFAEVTHHMLAAMTATMWYERGAPPPDVIEEARRKVESPIIEGRPSSAERPAPATRPQTPPHTTARTSPQLYQDAQDRELGRDPLSNLTVAARQIMLEIMNSAHTASSGCVYVDVLARSVKRYEGITTAEIESALDHLIEMGMIEMADDEGLWYKATSDVAYSGVYNSETI